LALKFKLYGTFLLNNVLPTEDSLAGIPQENQITFEVSREAATLVSPTLANLDEEIPEAPGLNDQMVFITDTYSAAQCLECPVMPVISVDALEQSVTRLYSLDAGGQILRSNLSSYSFEDLNSLLNSDGTERTAELAADLRNADWVIFSLLRVSSDRPSSLALQRLLAERLDLVQTKTVIVFAFNAPYFLDATEISKVGALYALYSKQADFVDVAARLLFKELDAPGSIPVSVSGIGYDLITATSPDPEQLIPMTATLIRGEETIPLIVSEITEEQTEVRLGDRLSLQTGVILDRNRNPVPNNTPVRFIITNIFEGITSQREITASTTDGIAQGSFTIDTPGTIAVRAASGDPAANSEIIQLAISSEGLQQFMTATAEAPAIEGSPVAGDGSQNGSAQGDGIRSETNFGDWALILLATLFMSLFAYQVGATAGEVRWGVRWGLTTLIGGMVVSTYLSLGLPGTAALIESTNVWGVVISAVAGGLIGWLAGWGWKLASKES
jgi:beta-N-acetylhexosaminidase